MASRSASSKVLLIAYPLACLLSSEVFSALDSDSTSNHSPSPKISQSDWQHIQMVPIEKQNKLCQLCSGMYVDPRKKNLGANSENLLNSLN